MEAAAQPLFYCLVEVLVKVFQTAYAQLAEIPVPVLVRTNDAVHICRGESQIDRKLPSSEPGRFAREANRAGRIRQLFAVVLKGYKFRRL
jgi:hypothetical protein